MSIQVDEMGWKGTGTVSVPFHNVAPAVGEWYRTPVFVASQLFWQVNEL